MSWWSAPQQAASSSEVEEAGVAAMRRSLASMLQEIGSRDAEIEKLREEQQATRRECTNLRKEMNSLHASKADKMMDVALSASVQALAEDAEGLRRVQAENSILTSELRTVEQQWAGPAAMTSHVRAGATGWRAG